MSPSTGVGGALTVKAALLLLLSSAPSSSGFHVSPLSPTPGTTAGSTSSARGGGQTTTMMNALVRTASSCVKGTTTRSSIHPALRTRSISSRRRKLPHHAAMAMSTAAGEGGALPHMEVDVVIIGGGHAGCEAAAASARTGASTVLLTQRKETIGELSCNPSIGGIGKGHIVREVDALDGVMGKVIDEAGIHFRMLNRRKGPAVRGPRAQADRTIYRAKMQELLDNYPCLEVVEGSAEDMLLDEGRAREGGQDGSTSAVRGVVTADGREILCNAVVITTGTFLRAKCFIGTEWYWAGRHLRDSAQVEPPSIGLAETLERFRFPMSRLKTGTPPRLNGETIDWGALEPQPSEDPPIPFSYMNAKRGVALADKLISCAKTYTNAETHKIVMASGHLLPDTSKEGVGPRYCPSIYKKCQRFPERDSHLSFLEPEGLNTNVVYPNGMSGPFREDIQLLIMRSMKGLDQVEIIRPAYDVEYDYVDPTCLKHTLETKLIHGLFLAGQICGTTGYEEAAAQGIVAGANAGLLVQDRPSFTIGRDEGYIGVLIDDLVTKGTKEPYRMFTSRAEYRLYLRADNADMRLTQRGLEAGIVGPERVEVLREREGEVSFQMKQLTAFSMTMDRWADRDLPLELTKKGQDGKRRTAAEVVSMPDMTLRGVEEVMRAEYNAAAMESADGTVSASHVSRSSGSPFQRSKGGAGDAAVLADMQKVQKEREAAGLTATTEQEVPPPRPAEEWAHDTVEAQCKYANYMERQVAEMNRWRKSQNMRMPADLQYTHDEMPSLSSEELEKLRAARPETLAAASQISGLTPHSVVYLYNHVARRSKARTAERKRLETFGHHFPGSGESQDGEAPPPSSGEAQDRDSHASPSS